ncbi:aminoacyl-tRNA hydrolase [Methylocaldum szegediense]|uniref:Peptidyl-tRNA hydrolase n=1 Tax=Methylocaldum szegediense TaxID=73780 RepID=A0ABN8X754_9GAMM|nr:aminoacyl-tRNA hydrolase [Methylocaldum szegediense]CAI8865817.1 peptidyl-tRNA hydrolase [Methylocaldum szegediense]
MGTRFKLVVGLGNPTAQYEKTRHNAGFWFVDEIAETYGAVFREDRRFQGLVAALEFGGGSVLLLKPMTFMNRSGQSVAALVRYYKITAEEMLVAHDELDFAPGVVRLKCGGGHGGHNGLRDLIDQLGTAGFWRIRIGIGHPGNRDEVVPYVLGNPGANERELICRAISRVTELFPAILRGELSAVTTRLHTDSQR